MQNKAKTFFLMMYKVIGFLVGLAYYIFENTYKYWRVRGIKKSPSLRNQNQINPSIEGFFVSLQSVKNLFS